MFDPPDNSIFNGKLNLLSSNFKTTNITFGGTGVKQILFGLALLYAYFVVFQNDRKPVCHFYTSSTEAQYYNTANLLFYQKNILITFLIIFKI